MQRSFRARARIVRPDAARVAGAPQRRNSSSSQDPARARAHTHVFVRRSGTLTDVSTPAYYNARRGHRKKAPLPPLLPSFLLINVRPEFTCRAPNYTGARITLGDKAERARGSLGVWTCIFLISAREKRARIPRVFYCA